MRISLITRVCLLLNIFTYNCISSSIENYPRINSVKFLGELTSSKFRNCKFFLIHGNFNPISSSRFMWLDTFEHLSANNDLAKHSGGAFNIQLNSNQTVFYPIKRPDRMVSSSCGVVIIILPYKITEDVEQILKERLEKPLKTPVTVKNTDRYFILTEDKYLQSIFHSGIISSIKYKLVLTEDFNGRVRAKQFCSYCPLGPVFTIDAYPGKTISNVSEYFPDLQKNYYGSVLRVSSSEKLPGMIEIEKIGVDKYRAKRGVYTYVLLHIVGKLNFTYDIKPSSGGSSTGHPLPNGTWVGSVGDIINGHADFSLICSITYLRFPVVDLCATITYIYVSFVIGPADKLFTWKAVFWPFGLDVWIGIVVSIFFAVLAAFGISKVPSASSPEDFHGNGNKSKKWGILSLVQYFGRTFIEQGDDELPVTLSLPIRVLLGWWLLFTLVAATAYKSKMVSLLTFPVFETVPDNFDELLKSNYHIIFRYFGNVAYNSFRTSTNPTIVNVFNVMSREPDPLKCLEQTVHSKAACIVFDITYEEMKYRNLSNRFGDSPIKISPNYAFKFIPGILHNKKAAFSSNFKRVINSAMEMGLINQWQKTDLNEILKNKNKWEKETGKSLIGTWNSGADAVLHLQNLIGPFTILIAGVAVAITIFIIEEMVNFTTTGRFCLPISRLKEDGFLKHLFKVKNDASTPEFTIATLSSAKSQFGDRIVIHDM